MTTSIRYTGSAKQFFEIALTGRSRQWTPGQQQDVSDAHAVTLIATNNFAPASPLRARSAGQLAGTPSADDIAISGEFFLWSDPTKVYVINAAGTAYVTVGGAGAATGTAAPLALAATAAAGSATAASHEDHVHPLPTINQLGGLPQSSGNYNAATNTVLTGPYTGQNLVSGTLPTGSGPTGFKVTVAGTPGLDSVGALSVGDELFYSSAAVWDVMGGAAVTTGLYKGDGTTSGRLVPAAPGVDFIPGPLMRIMTPFGIAPSGSVANNGVLTLGTALDQTYTNGLWLVFPSGALYAGSAAGAYWCVMSSTTVGQVYTSFIATTGSASITAGSILRPTAPVALSATTGPGAYTGVITAIYLPGTNMAAGYLGKQGSVEARLISRSNTTAGGKTCGAILASATASLTINGISSTTAAQTAQVATTYLADLVNAEVTPQSQDSTAFAVSFTTMDTSVVTSVQPRLSVATATDWVICEVFDVRAIPYPG